MSERSVEVFIGFGSNIDPGVNVPRGLELLAGHVTVRRVSTVYRTPPIGRPEQAAYRNGVWQIETSVSAWQLKFELLRPIEAELGRIRTEDRHAARPIDLDVLIWGDATLDEPDLRVPDPVIRERVFVAVPLLELAPELRLPGTGESLGDIVAGMDRSALVKDAELTDRLGRLIRAPLNDSKG